MRRKQQMIQMRGKSANRCSGGGGGGNGPAFTSPPPPADTTTRSHQKSSSSSSKTRSFRSSWTPFPSRMRSRSSSTTFSTSMSTWQGTFLLICALLAVLEIGCTFGAAAAAANSSHPTPSILERVTSSHGGGGGGGGGGHRHKCYLCLPPDKSSAEALDIYKMFKNNGGREQDVQDCTGFSSSKNKKPYEFDCPVGYQGCVLKTHGTNVSRTCAQFQFNACRVANAKELCFCTGPLCNDEKANMIIFPDSEGSSQQAASAAGAPPSPQTLPSSSTSLGGGESISSEERSRDTLAEEQEESESRKFWQKGETDDEDLLEMADDTGSSGDGPYPPGVIDAYTTTPKPTLVPNIRGDRVKTTPPPTTTAGGPRPPSASSFVPHLLLLLGSYMYYLSCYLVNMHHRP